MKGNPKKEFFNKYFLLRMGMCMCIFWEIFQEPSLCRATQTP